MILLTVDEVINLHSKLIAQTGGLDGLRDFGILESAISSAFNAFDETEQYPSIEEKSARLAYAITKNHAFVDGNKRIGVFVLLMTLKLNEVQILYTQHELVELGLSIADGSYEYLDILNWLNLHKHK